MPKEILRKEAEKLIEAGAVHIHLRRLAEKAREAAGLDQAVVLDDRGVLLGWLSQEPLRSDPATEVAAVMLEGPGTFRPNEGIAETASWMDTRQVRSILVTSSDGTFLGVVRRQDLDVAEPAGARAEA